MPHLSSKYTQPFIKWAGGKSQLLDQIRDYFPPSYNRYFEPFLGGGALFLYLRPTQAFLSDANFELISAWKVINQELDSLLVELKKIQKKKLTSRLYEQYKSMNPNKLTRVKRAVRFIFLNKTCYNGLYRVNKNGKFNVPMGSYKKMPTLFDENNLREISALLKHAEIEPMDYEIAVKRVEKNDFVYLDPPYLPEPGTNGFTSYTKDSFSISDEENLWKTFKDLDRKGCFVMLSNSATDAVSSRFHEFKETTFELRADRMINSVGTKRTGFTELLILNYEPPLQTLMQWVVQKK